MIISIIMILIWIIGTAEGDFERLCDILENVPEVKFICLDVANGYSQFFVEYVVRILLLFFQKNSWNCIKREKWFFFLQEKVRKAFPTHTILAGNVVTGDMVEALIFAGADIVKVGIFLHFFLPKSYSLLFSLFFIVF